MPNRYQHNNRPVARQQEWEEGIKKIDIAIRVISILNLVLGTLSIILQVPISAVLNNKVYKYDVYMGTGFWVGPIYIITGTLGLFSGTVIGAMKKRKILISTMMMSSICVPASWLAITASFSYFYIFDSILRETYMEEVRSMKIALGNFSIAASIINIILIITTSVVTCCENGCCCPPIRDERHQTTVIEMNQSRKIHEPCL